MNTHAYAKSIYMHQSSTANTVHFIIYYSFKTELLEWRGDDCLGQIRVPSENPGSAARSEG